MDNNIKNTGLWMPLPKSRIPLSNRSNASPPHYAPVRTKWDRRDSSKEQPSSHGSIYDAAWTSDSGSPTKSVPYDLPNVPTTTADISTIARSVTPPPARPVPDPNAESPLSRLQVETPFLYGHGTELTPIIEQRSISTLRTGNPSTSDISSLLKSQASATGNNGIGTSNSQPLPRPLRRQHSFSEEDLPPSFTSPSLTHYDNYNGESSTSARRGKAPMRIDDNAEASTSFAGGGDGISTACSYWDRDSTTGVPRLRSATAKRHSPPVVETVDVHAYPHQPAFPPHEPHIPTSLPNTHSAWLQYQNHCDGNPYPFSSSERPPYCDFFGESSSPSDFVFHPGFAPTPLSMYPVLPLPRSQLSQPLHPSQPRGLPSPPNDVDPPSLPLPKTHQRERAEEVSHQENCRNEPHSQPNPDLPDPTNSDHSAQSHHSSIFDRRSQCSVCRRKNDEWSMREVVMKGGRGWCSRCVLRRIVLSGCYCE